MTRVFLRIYDHMFDFYFMGAVQPASGLKSGSEALKQARASTGLTVRKVDDAMLEAEELIHEQVRHHIRHKHDLFIM